MSASRTNIVEFIPESMASIDLHHDLKVNDFKIVNLNLIKKYALKIDIFYSYL